MCVRKNVIADLIFLITVVIGGVSIADATPQRPTRERVQGRQATPDKEQRKKMRELREAMKAAQKEATQHSSPAESEETPADQTPPNLVSRTPLAADQVQFSYDNADLYDFVNQISDTLGISPIIIDPQVKGTVTIHSTAPMSKKDVFPLFVLILKNNNAALVKKGNIYQIVPISDALKKGLELIDHLPPPPAEMEEKSIEPEKTTPPAAEPPVALATAPPLAAVEPVPSPPTVAPTQEPPEPSQIQDRAEETQVPRLATHVIRVEFIPVQDLIEPLKLFTTEGGVIMPYDRLNMLIVTDYTDNVEKILEIVRLLDDNYVNADLIDLITINYNASADVLEDLKKIFGAGDKTGIYFVSLDRLNSILVMANSKRAMAEVKRWIDRLDATTGRSVQTFMYTVENSTASNIAGILGALYGGDGTGGGGAIGSQGAAPGTLRGGSRTGTRTGAGGSPFAGGGAGVGGGLGASAGGASLGGGFGSQQGFGGGFGSQQGSGGGFGSQQGSGGGGFGGGFLGGGQQLGPRLNLGAGMSTQVLTAGVFSGLQGAVRIVVDDLNNALIIQSSAADYAYISEVIKKLDVLPRQVIIDARIFAVDLTDALNFGVGATLQQRTGDPRATTAALAGAGDNAGALSVNTFAFVGNSREILLALDTLRSKTRVRLLEAPSVLALDGTQATIVVGSEVPYNTGSFVSATGTQTSGIGYRDTGVSLLVLPRISASGTVTLAVAQEVSSVGSTATGSNPIFNKSSVSTTLAVRDGETVAIAGIIRNSDSFARAGVPYLSDIPLLGALFGRTVKSVTRSELIILITPRVIRTPDSFRQRTQDLKDSLRGVRKLIDRKELEHEKDMEDAQEERRTRQQERERKEGKVEEKKDGNNKN